MDAWRTLSFTRPPDPEPGMWLFEEPLFSNCFLSARTGFSSATLRGRFVEACVVKLGHLMTASVERLAEISGIRSTRVLQNLVEEVLQSLSAPLRAHTQSRSLADQWTEGHNYVFPSLSVSPTVEGWSERSGLLLSMKTPALGTFGSCGGKQLYSSCVKVLNHRSLAGVRELRWTEVFGSDVSPKVADGSCISLLLRRGWLTSSGGLYMED
ncbi:uncharacterized protein LOC118302095 [Scophthalmus maximus]|uniref:uncharacterized protein LOC118302095 n=1 Tax=Scophthalmus maximus TaxID=52904 RepID=UPI001FA83672|nr:uncharacterized protein LOC118302095 [Scophthalmus maximus]XP_047187625.1 uncharacterized protein LOC118302095 [Scophthalmus maximus]